ncbi:hypothetical protein PC116_g25462 [Phytophthora cactorum]|nr:hypothetical protein PC116_g25462 [Phytophthora cactorum]
MEMRFTGHGLLVVDLALFEFFEQEVVPSGQEPSARTSLEPCSQ